MADTEHFTNDKNIPVVLTVAVFLDFEEAFDLIERNFIDNYKCLETFNFGLDLRQWITVLCEDMPHNTFM